MNAIVGLKAFKKISLTCISHYINSFIPTLYGNSKISSCFLNLCQYFNSSIILLYNNDKLFNYSFQKSFGYSKMSVVKEQFQRGKTHVH